MTPKQLVLTGVVLMHHLSGITVGTRTFLNRANFKLDLGEPTDVILEADKHGVTAAVAARGCC